MDAARGIHGRRYNKPHAGNAPERALAVPAQETVPSRVASFASSRPSDRSVSVRKRRQGLSAERRYGAAIGQAKAAPDHTNDQA
jgi:hypothetical protein